MLSRWKWTLACALHGGVTLRRGVLYALHHHSPTTAASNSMTGGLNSNQWFFLFTFIELEGHAMNHLNTQFFIEPFQLNQRWDVSWTWLLCRHIYELNELTRVELETERNGSYRRCSFLPCRKRSESGGPRPTLRIGSVRRSPASPPRCWLAAGPTSSTAFNNN